MPPNELNGHRVADRDEDKSVATGVNHAAGDDGSRFREDHGMYHPRHRVSVICFNRIISNGQKRLLFSAV